jgi:ketosteroid isomerase-like protein
VSQENVEIVRRAYAALVSEWRGGDFGAAWDAGDISPTAVLVPARGMPGPTEYRGRAGFVEFMNGWTEDFEEWSVEVERIMDGTGDRVVVFAKQTATGKRSGAPVELRYGQMFELSGGQIVRSTIYLDPADALAAAGLGD